MSTDAPTRTSRPHCRAGLVVWVEGLLTSEAQEKAVRAFASLATTLLLDDAQQPEVSVLEHLEGGGLRTAGSE